MTTQDVVIIGAGASGSSAAFHLANAGKKVTLLERNSHDLIKPCGGGMSAAVQNWFPFKLEAAVDEVINCVKFSWCLKDPVTAELPGSAPFWIVRRENLDRLITSYAINAGAELVRPFDVISLKRSKEIWQITSSDNKQVESRSVIIADGSTSQWPRQFGIGPKNNHLASTTSVRLKGRGSLEKGTARFEFGLVHHGFAWAFPINEGVTLGIGTFVGKSSTNSEEILEELLPNLGFNSDEGTRRESLLRVWNGHNPLHSNGIVAVGDAASLCDPFLAEGIRPALMSGCEAANCLNHFLNGDIAELEIYTENMRKRWGNSMAWARRISQVFYRFPKVGYQLGIKRPTAPQRIAEILSGQMDYGDIAQRVIKRLLFKIG